MARGRRIEGAAGGGPRRRPPRLQAESLLSTLRRHEVEFIVIGGFSLAAHGVVRGTQDIDIVPAPEAANFHRLMNALRELDAKVDLGDLGADELTVELSAQTLAGGGNWGLRTRFGLLDIMQDLAGLRDYAKLRARAVPAELDEVGTVLCASYPDLVAMKSAAGRDQDLIDIADMRRARGDTG